MYEKTSSGRKQGCEECIWQHFAWLGSAVQDWVSSAAETPGMRCSKPQDKQMPTAAAFATKHTILEYTNTK